MKWFTSDPHFNHFNIIKACKRPYQTKKEMNVAIIEQWNTQVTSGDVVYILGDFWFKYEDGMILEEILGTLKGNKILILGNHDYKNIKKSEYGLFSAVKDTDYIRLISGDKAFLSHYPHVTWRSSCHGSYHLYGHTHVKPLPYTPPNSLHVGWDEHNRLISEEDIPFMVKAS